MNSDELMIALGAAVLLSYWYLHLSGRYRVPSVVLLLLTGLGLRAATHATGTTVTPPTQLLPLLGTAGLVLIVLEGALDLRLEAGRRAFLRRTFTSALLGVVLTTAVLAGAVHAVSGEPWVASLLLAAPFGVISSAVAIPSAGALQGDDREFVIYESSWSDILGVMAFNALVAAWQGEGVTANLLGGGLAVMVSGVLISLAVYYLVGHLEGHVKFLPLLFALILVYAGAHVLHLSPLLIVLILGLLLNNPQVLHRFRVLRRLHSDHYDNELTRLKHVTAEVAFLVRTFFFLLLGYVTDLAALADPRAWATAIAVVAATLGVRWGVLRLLGEPARTPLRWLAPRGLITATLFFSIPAAAMPAGFPAAALILVVLISCVVMAVGVRASTSPAPGPTTASPTGEAASPASGDGEGCSAGEGSSWDLGAKKPGDVDGSGAG